MRKKPTPKQLRDIGKLFPDLEAELPIVGGCPPSDEFLAHTLHFEGFLTRTKPCPSSLVQIYKVKPQVRALIEAKIDRQQKLFDDAMF